MSELSTSRRPSRRPFFLGGVVAAALATGAAGVLIATSGSDPAAPGTTAEPITLAAASEVLKKASRAAAAEPDLKPEKGQFLYFESKSNQPALAVPGGEGQPGSKTHRRVWLPAFGGETGLLQNEGEGSIWLCDRGDNGGTKEEPEFDLAKPPTDCTNPPVYRTDLPTDAKAMKDWLYRNSRGGNPPDVQAFITVGDTIREHYIAPDALAAIFQAAAEIPGTKVYKNVTDSAGRPGIAVGQTWHGERRELIFDAKTFQLLGERSVVDYDNSFAPKGGKSPEATPWTPVPEQQATMKQGQVLYSTATLATAVVDKLTQRP